MSYDKADVQAFWDARACGEVYAAATDSREGLDKQARERYRLEPYIRDFARFHEGHGKEVLEIGIGMGADHLEWAKSGPKRLVGIDASPRAVTWSATRFASHGLTSDVYVGDAEHLAFASNSFDMVYAWGVLHHTPDTPQAFREAYRVLQPNGTLRVMIYHRPSIVGLTLWARYGLAAGHPTRGLADIYANHLESPGTKGYTMAEAAELVRPFRAARIYSAVSFADLLLGEVGQQHSTRALTVAKAVWPRPLIRRLPILGLLLLIEATK
ncbi:MAG TPA: class I SAM-dependent methyltransferase [Streptosporangiaceae bacterium]|nr:class I SAM-dependent methyltransferase [Streptosporangiaceae bacterium]